MGRKAAIKSQKAGSEKLQPTFTEADWRHYITSRPSCAKTSLLWQMMFQFRLLYIVFSNLSLILNVSLSSSGSVTGNESKNNVCPFTGMDTQSRCLSWKEWYSSIQLHVLFITKWINVFCFCLRTDEFISVENTTGYIIENRALIARQSTWAL